LPRHQLEVIDRLGRRELVSEEVVKSGRVASSKSNFMHIRQGKEGNGQKKAMPETSQVKANIGMVRRRIKSVIGKYG